MKKFLGVFCAAIFLLSNITVVCATTDTDTAANVEAASIYMDAEEKTTFDLRRSAFFQ